MLLFLRAGAALALSMEDAQSAYAEGAYLEAAELGEALRTSAGYALAAQSLVVHGHYLAGDEERKALFERAMGLAQEAIRFDILNAEAHFQSAHAMGRYAQIIGAVEALSEGYAGKVREALENALRLNPEMGTAHLSLAAWHSELVAKVGGFAARMVYGASRKEAIAHYERALELVPDEKVVRFEYALGLLRLDEEEAHEQVRALLERALEIPAKHAFDPVLDQWARKRLTDLDRETDEGGEPSSR